MVRKHCASQNVRIAGERQGVFRFRAGDVVQLKSRPGEFAVVDGYLESTSLVLLKTKLDGKYSQHESVLERCLFGEDRQKEKDKREKAQGRQRKRDKKSKKRGGKRIYAPPYGTVDSLILSSEDEIEPARMVTLEGGIEECSTS